MNNPPWYDTMKDLSTRLHVAESAIEYLRAQNHMLLEKMNELALCIIDLQGEGIDD